VVWAERDYGTVELDAESLAHAVALADDWYCNNLCRSAVVKAVMPHGILGGGYAYQICGG